MSKSVCIVWFRLDLRLEDNPALTAALARGGEVIPLYVWAPHEEEPWAPGAASRWWLHHSILRLQEQVRSAGSILILRAGNSLDTLVELAKETGASSVYWNRRYEPMVVARDRMVQERLTAMGIEARTFNASLLREPWEVANKSGKPYQVFSAYWRASTALGAPREPTPAPESIPGPNHRPKSDELSSLGLLPGIDWAQGIRQAWIPGTLGAKQRVREFLHAGIRDYSVERNRPDHVGTSRLSPHLHFGEIGPVQVWWELERLAKTQKVPASEWRAWQFVTELGWREFAHHLLHHFPHTPDHPLRPEFSRFGWRKDSEMLKAWQRGRTGVPLVDAGMRELWHTGWMHNRVRMVVASFLVKNLLVPWQAGARWFWDTLVDADLANNTLGWQWTAGCGADAAPFFRIFNPITQGRKFDPEGHYIRRWVPELSEIPARQIHQPTPPPADLLTLSGVEQSLAYPQPVVSLYASRERALEAYQRMRRLAKPAEPADKKR